MQERESIISYLLQQVDSKNAIIADLQKQVAELNKKLETPAASK